MKNSICIIFILFLSSCSQTQTNDKSSDDNKTANKIFTKEEIAELSKKYLVNIIPNPKLSSDTDFVSISNGEYPWSDGPGNDDYFVYEIHQKYILIGDLNGDNFDDAEVQLIISYGGNSATAEQLIFINEDGILKPYLHSKNLPDIFFNEIKSGILYGIEEKRDEDYNLKQKKVQYQLIGKKLVEIN